MKGLTIYYTDSDVHRWSELIDRELQRLGISRADTGNIVLLPEKSKLLKSGGKKEDNGK